MRLGRLHVITGDGLEARTVIDRTRLAVAAGAPVVQLRAKEATDRACYALAVELRALCDEHGATLIVDDRVDVALAAGADGVHLGDDDLPAEVVRRLLGSGPILGVTCRDPESARRAQAAGADYAGVGPAYATTTKRGLPAPLGPEGVGRVAAAVGIPVIAIAGITAARVPELLAAGAHGVAVVGAIYDAPDPGAATAELLAVLGAEASNRGAGTVRRRSPGPDRPFRAGGEAVPCG